MRQFFVVGVLVAGGVLAWKIGDTLSSDAISMGLGIFFGMLAGLPAALLVMAASRRRDYVEQGYGSTRRGGDGGYGSANGGGAYGGFNSQPPIIVVTAPGMLPQGPVDPRGQQANAMGLPMWPTGAPRPARQFHVVGERDEMVEEW
jgi:hypothetical protein